MNILVTGGAGYIGSHAAKCLALAGHSPVVYDNLSRGNKWAVRWGPFVHGELNDKEKLFHTLKHYGIDAVLHFAASAYIGESMREPGSYFQNNSVNSLNLLEVMKAARVNRIVFSSTCAIYGDPEAIPIAEDHPRAPVSPYGESKLFVEKLLHWFGKLHGLQWVALRYFNASGADPEGEIGECHCPETHLIPLVLEAALDQASPVSIFGVDYPTPDGTAVRDYIHVSDLANAHLKALDYLVANRKSRAFNLGTGCGHSIREVIDAAFFVTGHRPAVIEARRREGDPALLIADAKLANRELGWHPQQSSLPSIVSSAWSWRMANESRMLARAVAV